MFNKHHVLFVVIVLYLSYCFAADSKNSDIAVKNVCPKCTPIVGKYCAFKNEQLFGGGNCPKLSIKFFPPSNVIDCPQLHFSCRAACENHEAIVHIAPRHGANFTVRAQRAVQFIGWCSGNDTWAVKDVRTNIVYDDIIHAECQKLYENTPRYTDIMDRLGVSSTASEHSIDLHPDMKENRVNDLMGLSNFFDIFGLFARRC